MSVNDALGEVNEGPNFDSPNIKPLEDEDQDTFAAEEQAQKSAETVDIDGIPIAEKDIAYRASDIGKKAKMEYFVNVEGGKQSKKEEVRQHNENTAKQTQAEKENNKTKAEAEAKKSREAEKVRLIRKMREQAEAEAKKSREAEKARLIRKMREQAKTSEKESRAFAKRVRQHKRHKKISRLLSKIRHFFFGKWHKFITIPIIILIIAVPAYFAIRTNIEQEQKRAEEERQARIQKNKDEIRTLLNSDPIGSKDKIYSDIISIDDDEQTVMSAVNVMNIANYYHDEELHQEYLQKCKDRGGCQDDPEGKG